MAIPLSELAERIGATLVGDGSREVRGCASITDAGPDEVTFVANAKYVRHLAATRAAAVICDEKLACPEHLARLVMADPYFGFRNAMVEIHGFRRHPEPMDGGGGRRSPAAFIHPAAQVDEEAIVHPNVVVERGARVGARTVLYPGVYLGEGVQVGCDCTLHPTVVIYDRCIVGDRVLIHANTVIGQDGFGFATHAGRHHKIPQEGIVVIEDDVELGASCAIERAVMGRTRIGAGTKFGDLVAVGHNTQVGRHCLFVSLVGVAGSVDVGDYVVLGGQVGVAGHITIGDGVQAAGKTAIAHDVPPGEKIAGIPAQPLTLAKRNALAATRLHEHLQRLRALEREVRRVAAE